MQPACLLATSQLEIRDVHIAENRYTKHLKGSKVIGAGGKEICTAIAKLAVDTDSGGSSFVKKETKIDTCGSVSLAHRKFMTHVKSCAEYNMPSVRLHGVGGSTNILKRMGILNAVLKNGSVKKILAYEFNTPVGSTEEILLLSLRSTWDSKIDLVYHVEQSLLGNVPPLQFRDKISEEHKECVRAHQRYQNYQ